MDAATLTKLFIDVVGQKADPVRQRQLLIDRLKALLACKLGWLFVADNYKLGLAPIITHQVLTGDMHPDWVQYITDFVSKFPPEDDLYAWSVYVCDDPVQLWTRYQLFHDEPTRLRYAGMINLSRQLKVGDGLIAAYRGGPDNKRVSGFSLHRDEHTPNFCPDDLLLARAALELMDYSERGGHLSFRVPADADLAPRLHQVLDRLLCGKAPKEIATELRLSVHTVRDHIKRLYERYNVTSREELTSRFVR